jgi:hypothetical protein
MVEKSVQLSDSATANTRSQPAQPVTATEYMNKMGMGETVTGRVVARLWSAWKKTLIGALMDCQERLSVNDIVAITGCHNQIARKFRDTDLDTFLEITPKHGLMTADDEQILMQMFTLAPQFGDSWPSVFDPQAAWDIMTRHRRFGQTMRDYHIEQAEWENQELRKRFVPPDLNDDHDLHDYQHDLYYAANRRHMSKFERRNFRHHMDGHKRMKVQVIAEMASLAAQAKSEAQKEIVKILGPDAVQQPAGQTPGQSQPTAQRAAMVGRTAPEDTRALG